MAAFEVFFTGRFWVFPDIIESIDGFPYEMTEERKRLILEGYESLKVGMHKEEALELLGPPDAEFFTYNESQTREFVDSSWCYYLTRAEEELADPSDRAVFLYFTTEDTLYWAMGTNVASLKTLGSPDADR